MCSGSPSYIEESASSFSIPSSRFVPLEEAKKTYQNVILSEYRTALLDIESSVYPNIRQKWFIKAQQNIIRQLKIDTKYNTKIKQILDLAPDIDIESSNADSPINIKTAGVG